MEGQGMEERMYDMVRDLGEDATKQWNVSSFPIYGHLESSFVNRYINSLHYPNFLLLLLLLLLLRRRRRASCFVFMQSKPASLS